MVQLLRNEKGLTLAEALIVVFIIATLTAIAVPVLSNAPKPKPSGRESKQEKPVLPKANLIELESKAFKVEIGESFSPAWVGEGELGHWFEINSSAESSNHDNLEAWVLFYKEAGKPKRVDLPRYGKWVFLTEDNYKGRKIGVWAHISSYSEKAIAKNHNYNALGWSHEYRSRESLNQAREVARATQTFEVFIGQFYKIEYPTNDDP